MLPVTSITRGVICSAVGAEQAMEVPHLRNGCLFGIGRGGCKARWTFTEAI